MASIPHKTGQTISNNEKKFLSNLDLNEITQENGLYDETTSFDYTSLKLNGPLSLIGDTLPLSGNGLAYNDYSIIQMRGNSSSNHYVNFDMRTSGINDLSIHRFMIRPRIDEANILDLGTYNYLPLQGGNNRWQKINMRATNKIELSADNVYIQSKTGDNSLGSLTTGCITLYSSQSIDGSNSNVPKSSDVYNYIDTLTFGVGDTSFNDLSNSVTDLSTNVSNLPVPGSVTDTGAFSFKSTNASGVGLDGVAIGQDMGLSQNDGCIAIGSYGGSNQDAYSIAIGSGAGVTQSVDCIAIGTNSGNNQGFFSVAIGSQSGYFNQGQYCVALGNRAGKNDQSNNTIIINATNGVLNGDTTPGLYIKPIANASYANSLYYDTTSGAITYDLSGGGAFTDLSNTVTDISGRVNVLEGVSLDLCYVRMNTDYSLTAGNHYFGGGTSTDTLANYTVDYDNAGMFSNDTFTIQTTGLYRILYNFAVTINATTNHDYTLRIYRNGNSIIDKGQPDTTNAFYTYRVQNFIELIYPLTANDTIYGFYDNNSSTETLEANMTYCLIQQLA